jgi:cell pole-organizing protein PopZ
MADIQDPSMEDILASIKRVIRDDARQSAQSAPAQPQGRAARRTRPEPAPAPAEDEDVLELNEPMDAGEPLMSPDAAIASRQSLAALSAARAAPAPEGGALENVVRDMLRPMLKEWLDENLPQIVEELVTREIARITGRNL